MGKPRVVIFGGSGFIGDAVASALRPTYQVVVVGRSQNSDVQWDGHTLGNWVSQVDGAEVVINLSGASIQLPLTEANRELILNSRVESTRAVADAIRASVYKPKLWLNASAIGFYGDRGDSTLDENSPSGTGFLAETSVKWEEAFFVDPMPETRRVALRFGVVLGREGGAFPKLKALTRLFLGGQLASGKAWQSWIHIVDLVGIVLTVIDKDFEGVLNVVSPEPLRNRDWMATFRRVMHKPYSPPVPKFLLKLMGKVTGPSPEVILVSTRVTSVRVRELGCPFFFPTFETAIRDLLK